MLLSELLWSARGGLHLILFVNATFFN
eukprot:SAG11_NODE_31856_length_288_cov_1.095238_1_plen_26_part_10